MSYGLAMNHRALVAFGANLGDRQTTIDAALREMDALPGVQLTAVSPCYASDPVGYADQSEFINGVAAFDTAVAPDVFLKLLLHTEKLFGRERGIRNGPRTLDLDLLFYDGETPISETGIELPHPRWSQRAFVTAPLADLLAMKELANDERWDGVREKLKTLTDRSGIRRL